MNRGRKIMFVIIGIIVIVAVLGTIAVRYHLSTKERKARVVHQALSFFMT